MVGFVSACPVDSNLSGDGFYHWLDTLEANNQRNNDPSPDNNAAATLWEPIKLEAYESANTAGFMIAFSILCASGDWGLL